MLSEDQRRRLIEASSKLNPTQFNGMPTEEYLFHVTSVDRVIQQLRKESPNCFKPEEKLKRR